MYDDNSEPNVRFTIGSERTGLTYYLSREKLEQLSTELDESEHLENNTSASTITDETPAKYYRLESSYFTWLERSYPLWFDQITYNSEFYKDDHTGRRPPRPFVDRVHDLTFRLNPQIKPSASPRWFAARILEHFIQKRLTEGWSHWLAMSAAALLYGGLHLLAWNAPFHAPIHSLLWKVSGITTASLGIVRLLGALASFDGYDSSSRWQDYLQLVVVPPLVIGMFAFALLYVFARVYLVVESFLSLAYLPDSVCVTPNFSLYFPHIG